MGTSGGDGVVISGGSERFSLSESLSRVPCATHAAAALTARWRDVGVGSVKRVPAQAMRLSGVVVDAVPNHVIDVLGPRPPRKILDPVVGVDTVAMQGVCSFRARPYEGFEHYLMNLHGSPNRVPTQRCRQVAELVWWQPQHSLRKRAPAAVYLRNDSSFGADASAIGNRVKALIAHHWEPALYAIHSRHLDCRRQLPGGPNRLGSVSISDPFYRNGFAA